MNWARPTLGLSAVAAAAALAAACGGGAHEGVPGIGPSPSEERREEARLDRERPRGSGQAEREPPRPQARLIRRGPRDRRRVALTFDADMTPEALAAIRRDPDAPSQFDAPVLEELEETRTRATIFMAGLWARAHPDVARRIARSPLFEVANHSLTHRAFDAPCFGLEAVTGEDKKREEVVRSHAIIEEVTGESPYYFRFPGGCHTESDLDLVGATGEQSLGWDVVGGDPGQPDASVIVDNVLGKSKPGSIVVLHIVGAPNSPATAEALPEIISGLRDRGFELVTVGELLGRRTDAPNGADE